VTRPRQANKCLTPRVQLAVESLTHSFRQIHQVSRDKENLFCLFVSKQGMDEPEKVTGSVGEALMGDSKPVMEETETETGVVAKAVMDDSKPAMEETETGVVVAEALMHDSKPVMEETETVVVAKAEAEAETGAGEVKVQVQVEEPTKLEEDDGKLKAEPVGDNPDSVEQQQRAVENTGKSLNIDDTRARNEEKLKPEVVSVDVEDRSLVETATKMDDVGHGDNDGDGDGPIHSHDNALSGKPNTDMKPQDDGHGIDNREPLKDLPTEREINTPLSLSIPNLCFDNSGSDTEEDQAAFVKEVEAFYKEKNLEFKHPKFYKEDLNLLKLWRAVIKLGGYEQVTSCKLWRQVGESFNPPKTCTTVSWTFRIFYEKALLEYEKHKIHGGMLPHSDAPFIEPNGVETQAGSNQAPGSGRAKRDAAARAMRSWHSQRVLDNGEVCHPIIKDKISSPTLKSDRQLKNFGLLKRKKPSAMEPGARGSQLKATKQQTRHCFGRLDTMVVDIGSPADWVKVNVVKTVDCYEVYALVPGLLREEVRISLDNSLFRVYCLVFCFLNCMTLRGDLLPGHQPEEVHVQSDPAGRLVISGQPKELDNPWGVTPFKKVVSLPSRIDSHQTSAVVTLHGQLFVRVPYETPDV
ncbi:hypothetical protein V6N13_149405, partial [Hibiscus sabdariffa]